LVKLIELVDELGEVVARLLNGSHQRHESHVIALSVEFRQEQFGLEDRKSVGQRFGVSHNFMVVL